jgi:uncharacterized membrane protein
MAEPPLQDLTEDMPSAVRRNIEAIARLEASYVRDRAIHERIADWIGGFSGSLTFVVIHFVFYGAWILVNLGVIRAIPRFDKFPFLLLSVVVSLEAIFLSTFVLMKQNRMSKRADQRAHLDLQINLLAEREMTVVLQILHRISTRLGVRTPGEAVEEFSEVTSIEALAQEISKNLADE